MKILFIGDISGAPGREVVKAFLPQIKTEKSVDFVIANAENSAHGKGITRDILNELSGYGIDFFTSGDHMWDQKGFIDELYDTTLPIVRFFNYEGGKSIPGKPYEIIDLGSKKLVVASFQGMAFMRFHVKNPFWSVDDFFQELLDIGINRDNAIIIIDFHAESTAEKLCFAEYVKGRATAVVGTHTHVGTADARILSGATAYITDIGMAGPLDASLWGRFEEAIHNIKFPFRKSLQMEEEGKKQFNAVLISIDDDNKATCIERVDRVF